MGSGQSTVKPAEKQTPETGTQLFGSWDKPVAEAYALKKQVSRKGKAAASKAADASGAALDSAIDLEAGAGVKPSGRKTPDKQKGAGPSKNIATKKRGEAWTLSQSSKDPAKVTAAKQALKGRLSKPLLKQTAQGTTGKKNGEARTVTQPSQMPAKVAAAQKASPGMSNQGKSAKKAAPVQSAHRKPAGVKKSTGEAWTAGTSSKSPALVQKRKQALASKLGVKKNSGVVKKSKAAASTAGRVAGRVPEAAQEVATAGKGAAAHAATAAQGAATAVKNAATKAVNSAQKAVKDSGVMESTAVAEVGQVASKMSEVAQEAAHTVQGAMSVAVMQAGAAGGNNEGAIKKLAANTPKAGEKAKPVTAAAKSEVQKSAGKVAKAAPKTKKALKRMVSEIDAEVAKTEGLGRGKRQRKQVKTFEPSM